MAEGKLMKQENKVYFLAGYIYAQAESVVRDYFPNLADLQMRKETNLIYERIMNDLLKEELNRRADK